MLLCVAGTVGCTRMEQPEPVTRTEDAKVFYAETPSSSKTYVDTEGSIYWHEGENISVFRSVTNEKYQFQGKEGEIVNEFRKVGGGETGALYSKNYAVYPYSESTASTEEGIFSVNIPETQHYVENSFGNEASMMVAVTKDSEDDVFYFKNVCGYFVLKIYGGDVIRSIKLTGNSGEKISGTATLSASYGSAPQIEMSQDAGAQIVLDCGEDGAQTETDSEKYTTFWMAVPPVTFENGFTVEVTTVNGTKMSQSTTKSKAITQNKVMTMAAFECSVEHSHEFTSFSLSDETNTYPAFDISNGYVNIMIPNDADLSELTASFTYKGAYVKLDDEEQTSGVGSHNFSDFCNPLQYTVTGGDGIEQTYSIRLFDLPVLIIDTPNHQPITSKTVWIPDAIIKMMNPDNTEIDLGKTQIKGRGNTTWGYPQKPYALKFDSKQSFWGLPKHKRWCLLANWMDKTLIRNAVAYEIARKCDGLEWTPDGDYVEVILNGEHIGNYYLCEQIKIDKYRVNISEDNGYILTLDMQWDEAYKFKSAIRELPYMFKDPDEVTEEQFNAVQSYVNEMESSLYDDEKFASRDYLKYLDVPSIIDYFFVFELAMNHEPINPKSVYMYREGESPFFTGPVWDFDWGTFVPGRVHSWQIKDKAMYYPRLFQDQQFKNEVFRRWTNQKTKFESITDFLDAKAIQLERSESRDRVIWPFTNTTNGEVGLTYDQAVARMRKAFLDKLAWMDAQIRLMPVYDEGSGNSEDFSGQEDKSGETGFTF